MSEKLLSEETVPLGDIPGLNWIPRRRGGKRIHKATLYRWAQRGLQGVVLDTLPVGATLCTSREALGRFFMALAERRGAARAPSRKPGRTKSILRAAGIANEQGDGS